MNGNIRWSHHSHGSDQTGFGRLAKHNVKLNGLKCQFFQAQVKYMGHILSKEGITPVKSKLDAIRLAPRPKDVSHLQ